MTVGRRTAAKAIDAKETGALNRQHPPHTHHRAERGGGAGTGRLTTRPVPAGLEAQEQQT